MGLHALVVGFAAVLPLGLALFTTGTHCSEIRVVKGTIAHFAAGSAASFSSSRYRPCAKKGHGSAAAPTGPADSDSVTTASIGDTAGSRGVHGLPDRRVRAVRSPQHDSAAVEDGPPAESGPGDNRPAPRERGLTDEGYGQRARSLAGKRPASPRPGMRTVLDVMRRSRSAADPDRRRQRPRVSPAPGVRPNRTRGGSRSRARGRPRVGATFWLAFDRGEHSHRGDVATDTLRRDRKIGETRRSSRFRRAICRGCKPETLRAIVEREGGGVETKYFLGPTTRR